ncbi:MAG TPA: DEAD/DEAH box helicase [Devosia sp.]|nr:DEAD/DEAH box helicase [Devosia sp.]
MSQNFSELGLPSSLVKSLEAVGFTTPTTIQAKAIPPQLAGRDILGIAQTGSGKTAAFSLPILAGLMKLEGRPEPRTARALILVPTRELAVQIDEVIRSLAGNMRLTTLLVLGGVSRSAQVQKLSRGADIVIATPGRLMDLIDDRKLKLDHTRWLVLDEADRMLDMGFIKPVRAIAALIPVRRQTALFSATMAPEVGQLAQGLLRDPVRVEAAPPATTAGEIEQSVILTPAKGKRAELNRLLADPALDKVLIFARTKHGADRVAKNLEIDGHDAAAIHGNKSQNARQAALKGFANGRVRLLVATDIAARGIDVAGITHVINYELPDDAENYVHRIGRTGRNGASGVAITLVDSGEAGKLRDVERLIRRKLPASGDWHLNAGERPAEAMPARQEPRRQARPAGRPGHKAGEGRPQQRGRADAPAKGPAGQLTRKRADAPAPREAVAKAGATGKPRWSRDQKLAAKARRAAAATAG